MDKTLMRPLFRDKATQLNQPRKIDGSKVPKYAIGAAIQLGRMGIAGLGRVVQPAYQYLRTKAGPSVGRFLEKPSTQTSLSALGAYGTVEGADMIKEGIEEADPYKAIQGASFAVPGLAFLPSTLKKSGIGALRKAGEKLGEPTTKFGKFAASGLGGYTALGTGIGAGVLGAPEEVEAAPTQEEKQQQYIQDVQDRLMYKSPSEAEALTGMKTKPEETEAEALSRVVKEKGGKRAVALRDPKTKGEAIMSQQLQDIEAVNQVAKKLGITDVNAMNDKQIKQVAVESNVNEQDLRTMINKPKEPITPPNPAVKMQQTTENLGAMNPAEVKNIVGARKKDLDLAKDNSLNADFQSFKTKLNQLTGANNDNLLNLVAMKAAGKLLSGQTKQSGVRGFLEVGGTALEGAANDMMQLALAQKAEDMELAKAFLKARSEAAEGPGFESGDKTFSVPDDTVPGGRRNIIGSLGKDARIYLRTKNNQVVLAPEGFVGTEFKPNQDKIAFYGYQLEENKRGSEMIDYVISNVEKTGGPRAAFGLLSEDVFGTFDQFMSQRGMNQTSSSIDSDIRNQIAKNRNYGATEKEREANNKLADKLSEQYTKDIEDAATNGGQRVFKQLQKAGIVAKNYRPTEEDLTKYTKFALIEQRMKYIVANANKSEDRLTQKDIDNAAKRTQIVQFFGSPRTIRKNYQNLKEEFRNKAQGYVMQYKNSGGTEEGVQYYMDVPGVKELYDQKRKEIQEQKLIKNKESKNQIQAGILKKSGIEYNAGAK
jgi:hypothetical protein